MSKDEESKDCFEEQLLLEKDLYKPVEDFLSTKIGCCNTGSADSSSISLNVFGGVIYPDVFGIINPKLEAFKIYMAEGKRDFSGRNFDICKGQGLTLQRFADFVYLFFPKESWKHLTNDEQTDIIDECKNLKLGLLLIDNKNCEEIITPSKNEELLDSERKTDAKNVIVNYFPDFNSQENVYFFKNFSTIAKDVVRESCSLLEDCKHVFRQIMGVSSAHTLIYYDSETRYFQFAFKQKRFQNKNFQGRMYLTMNPFGASLFETNKPIMILEKWFSFNYFNEKDRLDSMKIYVRKSLKSNEKVEIITSKEKFLLETYKQFLTILKQPENEIQTLIVYEPIEVVGREIEKIIKNVKKRLINLDSFLKSPSTTKKSN